MEVKKFPDINVSTQKEHKGSQHNLRRARFFPPHLKMRVHFPASLGKESRSSRSTSSRGGLTLKVERKSRDRATIPKDPDVPTHSRFTGFPCTDYSVTLSIDSKHDGTCDSIVTPRGKATDSYVNTAEARHYCYSLEGKRTWMSHQETRPDSPVETP